LNFTAATVASLAGVDLIAIALIVFLIAKLVEWQRYARAREEECEFLASGLSEMREAEALQAEPPKPRVAPPAPKRIVKPKRATNPIKSGAAAAAKGSARRP